LTNFNDALVAKLEVHHGDDVAGGGEGVRIPALTAAGWRNGVPELEHERQASDHGGFRSVAHSSSMERILSRPEKSPID
jgi:hypothetical protein